MGKKARFPLDMGNNVKARSIEELKANYNAEKVTEYFLNGKLLTWLENRYYDEEAEKVRELSEQSYSDPAAKLAEIFGVEIEESVDVEMLEIRRKKLEKLREITSEDEILDNVDHVAFSQEELGDLLDDEIGVIYLCGESFRIPLSVKNVRYVGVNNPDVTISGKGEIDLEANWIIIERCELSEDTKERIVSQNAVNEDDEYADIEYTDEKYFKFENKDGWVRLKKYTGKDSVVKIPSNVNEIYTRAFKNNEFVEKIIIPNSVTKIDSEAFAMCENLEYINIPYGVEEIGVYTFQNCNLKNIKIPDSVTKIDVGAFKGCKYLVNITLPCSLAEIGDQAFEDCESLIKIDLPDGLTIIGSYAFDYCENLKEIDIPNSVTEIGYQAFSNCKRLKSINNVPDSRFNIVEYDISPKLKITYRSKTLDNAQQLLSTKTAKTKEGPIFKKVRGRPVP